VAARLAAQQRAGVPEPDRAPLYSSEAESYLLPHLLRFGRGAEAAMLTLLRRDFRRLYGEHAETVLRFMLRAHAGIRAPGCSTSPAPPEAVA
jgi:hypothetical protein